MIFALSSSSVNVLLKLSKQMRIILSKCHIIHALLLIFLFISSGYAHNRKIVITIDDLPFVGEQQNTHLNRIIQALKQDDVPATGFIIANNVKPQHWSMLRKFRDAGFSLGNHTSSHINLNQVDADTYIQDVEAADRKLESILSEPKFFRYPYLAMGDSQKKDKVIEYLNARHYHIAGITIDSKDFIFNQLLLSVPEKSRRDFMEVLTPTYINFIWQQTLKAEERARMSRKSEDPQILLVHANLLNAYALPDIINLYRINGYRFVRLEDTLKKSGSYKAIAHQFTQSRAQESVETFMEWD